MLNKKKAKAGLVGRTR